MKASFPSRTNRHIEAGEMQKISVIIPFYNGSEYIEAALESIKRQTMTPYEVIVVDDGSTAAEHNFLESLVARFGFLLTRIENRGQSAARNHGVNLAQGSLVCFLDQDDQFFANHIEVLYKKLESGGFKDAFAYGDAWRRTESGIITAHSIHIGSGAHPRKSLGSLISSDMMILPSASMIVKEMFSSIGGFDSNLQGYEDDDLFLRFFTSGYSSSYADEPVLMWTVNPNSVSFSERMATSRFSYYEKLRDKFTSSEEVLREIYPRHIVPRFRMHFVADIISAAYLRSLNFRLFQSHLKRFRKDLRDKHQKGFGKENLFLLLTIPLVYANERTVRFLSNLASLFSGPLTLFGFPGIREFVGAQRRRSK